MAASALDDLTEKEWTAQLLSLLKTLGWSRYHTYRSKNSEAGWPDEALVRERLILAEMKRERGKPSAAQVEWLDRLSAAGQEVYLWVPSDLDEIGTVLGKRWHYDPARASLISTSTTDWLEPGSLWLPHIGRRDGVRVPSEQVSLLPNP